MATPDDLPSWNDTPTRQAIVDFVAARRNDPTDERVAVFDNDGTVWCEKPMPVHLDLTIRRSVPCAAPAGTARRSRPGVRPPHGRCEDALAQTKAQDWPIVSIRDDWSTVFAP